MDFWLWRHRLLRRWGRYGGGAAELSPLWVTLAVGLILAVLVIALLETRLRPMVAAAAQAQTQNTLTAVVENAVTAELVSGNTGYGDLVAIQREEEGAITSLTTDMAAMNLLRARLVSAVLEALDGIKVSDIRIPLGSLLDLDVLWAKGPSLRVHSMRVGTVDAEFSSQFSSAGVNQTLHRIWLDLSVSLTLMLPGGGVETKVDTRLCVAETVIVGQVPQVYLDSSGLRGN